MRFLKAHWPSITLLAIVLLLALINTTPGTFLTGWDNLHPEFYFSMNVKRSLFAVWQEYQGLGLLGGMGHATDLLRQLLLWGLSVFLPVESLRYLWTYLMIFLGPLGVYYLLRYLVFKDEKKLFPFMGALFYLLNLSMIQTFFVPFEAFISHYGFLPWMLFASLFYVEHPTRKRLWFLIVTLFATTAQSYIPTLFVVYILALGALLGTQFLLTRTKSYLFRLLKLGSVIVIVNAFWLFPFLYFTATNASVNLESKINQMATETIYLQNKEFGNITNVALLKGFWFNNVDPNENGDFTYMLEPWREHLENPLVIIAGYLLFAVVMCGLLAIVKRREKRLLPYVGLLFLALTALAVATFPFSLINLIVRETIPILNQAFRFPYTKFSNLTALSFAILFSLGFQYFFTKLHIKNVRQAFLSKSVTIIAIGAMVLLLFPTLKGDLFYHKERLEIPQEYFAVFDFFKQQDPHTRIANFPQHTFWGWNFNQQGYGGSGFLWYGIRQPILDRAFDVWSKTDENYYFEASQALYSKDEQAFNRTLQKYQISWILLDKNVINPISPKALYTPELEMMLMKLSSVRKAASFGNIDIYRVNLKDSPSSYVMLTPSLPHINEYSWSHDDIAYKQIGNYVASKNPEFIYPFRSLFSQKTEAEQAYSVSKQNDSLTLLSQETLTPTTQKELIIPSYGETETIIPVTYSLASTAAEMTLSFTVYPPTLSLNNRKVSGGPVTKELLRIPTSVLSGNTIILNTNGAVSIPLSPQKSLTTFLSLKEDNILVLTDETKELLTEVIIKADALRELPELQAKKVTIHEKGKLSVTLPAVTDAYLGFTINGSAFSAQTTCDTFRKGPSQVIREDGNKTLVMRSQNATACVVAYLSNLVHEQGYVVSVTQTHQIGRGLHFWMLNEDAQYAPLDTFLPNTPGEETITMIVPPQERFGRAYSFHFDNSSIGSDVTQNTLKELRVHPIPYTFLTTLYSGPRPLQEISPSHITPVVSHPNESLYVVKNTTNLNGKTLTLSQSFDSGWKAYIMPPTNSGLPSGLQTVLPFVFGKPLTTHLYVNNWENGWVMPQQLPEGSSTVIVYLPQYLEYAGFLVLLLTVLGLIITPQLRSSRG